MLDILLVVQVVLGILLIAVILMQRSSSDGLLGSGGGVGGGIVTAKSAANFFVKATIVLAICFMINSIILANLSSRNGNKDAGLIKQIEEVESNSVPMAK